MNKAREKSIKAMEKKRERDSESSWIVGEREKERGEDVTHGCHSSLTA